MYDHDNHSTQATVAPVPPARERAWNASAILVGIAILFVGSLARNLLYIGGGLWLVTIWSAIDSPTAASLKDVVGPATVLVMVAADIALGIVAGWQVARLAPTKWLVDSIAAGLIVVLFTNSALRVELVLFASTVAGAAIYKRRHRTIAM